MRLSLLLQSLSKTPLSSLLILIMIYSTSIFHLSCSFCFSISQLHPSFLISFPIPSTSHLFHPFQFDLLHLIQQSFSLPCFFLFHNFLLLFTSFCSILLQCLCLHLPLASSNYPIYSSLRQNGKIYT